MLWDNNKNIKMIGQHDPDDLERSNNCAVRGFWNGTLWAAITSAAMGGEHYYYTRVKGVSPLINFRIKTFLIVAAFGMAFTIESENCIVDHTRFVNQKRKMELIEKQQQEQKY